MTHWPIYRTKPLGKTPGRAFPIFICNMSYHLTTLDVFADGVIDCWGLVDLDFFHRKIASGWIASQAPIGATLSIFNLGACQIADAEWQYATSDVVQHIEQAIRDLNPSLTGLIDFGGTDIEIRNGARYAKLGLADDTPYYLNADGSEIAGTKIPIFVVAHDRYQLTNWFLFADRYGRIGATGDIVPIEQSLADIHEGRLTTTIPDGAWVSIDGLGHFRVDQGWWSIDPHERIREALDELAILNGEAGTISTCMQQLERYEQDPSDEQCERLRQAYEAVPEHLRRFCGDMDSKDWPIRYILYGDEGEE